MAGFSYRLGPELVEASDRCITCPRDEMLIEQSGKNSLHVPCGKSESRTETTKVRRPAVQCRHGDQAKNRELVVTTFNPPTLDLVLDRGLKAIAGREQVKELEHETVARLKGLAPSGGGGLISRSELLPDLFGQRFCQHRPMYAARRRLDHLEVFLTDRPEHQESRYVASLIGEAVPHLGPQTADIIEDEADGRMFARIQRVDIPEQLRRIAVSAYPQPPNRLPRLVRRQPRERLLPAPDGPATNEHRWDSSWSMMHSTSSGRSKTRPDTTWPGTVSTPK